MKINTLIKKIESIANKFDIDSDCLYEQINLDSINDIDYEIIGNDNKAKVKLIMKG